ncbi:hypothetical protein [Acidovorax sp.]|uniref:hypothetical protein n=1 Tax=Acidovorax sp. TaxID=1872122 RepID=UPI002ACE4F6C|nr:hypothetical protein [Acidovorax sp.]MDZ7863366.1 hypothetical protein [Acidovorax sp.]
MTGTTTAVPPVNSTHATWSGEYLPDLLIETGRPNGLLEIGQSTGNGEHSAIEIHPSQVRYIAQKLGMVRELTGDEAAAREALQVRVRMLERDLRRLGSALALANDMAQMLYQNIVAQNSKGHEDLEVEASQAATLSDLLDLYCEEYKQDDEDDGRSIYPPTTAQQDVERLRNMKPAPAAQAANPQAARASVKPKDGDLFGGGAN